MLHAIDHSFPVWETPSLPQALQSERDSLQQRLSALKERLQDAARRVEAGKKDARAAAKTGEGGREGQGHMV